MSAAKDMDEVLELIDEDEPTVSEAMELWAYLRNPREMIEAGRRERGGGEN